MRGGVEQLAAHEAARHLRIAKWCGSPERRARSGRRHKVARPSERKLESNGHGLLMRIATAPLHYNPRGTECYATERGSSQSDGRGTGGLIRGTEAMFQALKRTHERGRYSIRPANYGTKVETAWTALGKPRNTIEQALRLVSATAAEAGDSRFHIEVQT